VIDLLAQFLDIVLNLDVHLAALMAEYGTWVYAILFLIVFCETGLVVTPFLPGDSLLFVAGTLWAAAGMDAHWLCATLITAALLGDNVNYFVGRAIGPRVFQWEDSRFFNRKALDRTHGFYERHGGKTIVIARFVPVVRSFAPLVAGASGMDFRKFQLFNVAGAALWVVSLVGGGYLFGNVPIVRDNLGIILIVGIAAVVGPLALAALMRVVSAWQRPAPAAARPAPMRRREND
jgi:membrane-associated protein